MLVSVILPVRNEARHLPEQLQALSLQSYGDAWQLVVADDGSTDDSLHLIESAARQHGWDLTVLDGPQAGPGPARNAAVARSDGDLLCLCDADDVVSQEWLAALVEASKSADLVVGALDRTTLNDRASVLSRGGAGSTDRTPTFASSCNMAIWRRAFDQLEGFDARYRQGEDVDLSWRAIDAGLRLAHAPDAVVAYRYRSDLRRSFRQAIRMGFASEQLHRAHPTRTGRLSAVEAVSKVGWLALRAPYVALPSRRLLWFVQLGGLAGRIAFHLRRPESQASGSAAPPSAGWVAP